MWGEVLMSTKWVAAMGTWVIADDGYIEANEGEGRAEWEWHEIGGGLHQIGGGGTNFVRLKAIGASWAGAQGGGA